MATRTKRKWEDTPEQHPAAKSRRVAPDAGPLLDGISSGVNEVSDVDSGDKDSTPGPERQPEESQPFKHIETQDLDFEILEQSPVTRHPQPPNESQHAQGTGMKKLVREDSDLTPKCRCLLDEHRWTEEHCLLTYDNLHCLAFSTKTEGPRTITSLTTCSADGFKTCPSEAHGINPFDNEILDDIKSGMHPITNEIIAKTIAQNKQSTPLTQSGYHEFATRLCEASSTKKTLKLYKKYIFQPTEDCPEGFHGQAGYLRQEFANDYELPPNMGFDDELPSSYLDVINGLPWYPCPPILDDNSIRSPTVDKTTESPSSSSIAPRPLPHLAITLASNNAWPTAKLQSAHAGAAMVHARNEALAHINQPDPPRHAAVVTVAICGPLWEVFAHYAHTSETTGRCEYYQYSVGAGSMSTLGAYEEGRRVLREVQAFARGQALGLRERLRRHWEEHGARQHREESSAAQTESDDGSGGSVASDQHCEASRESEVE